MNKFTRFLNDLNIRTDGRLAPDWRPEFVLVGDGPEGYLLVPPPCRTAEEWAEKYRDQRDYDAD